MSGFHNRKIQKGIYGELSKIEEELQEAYDAEEQGQDLMLLIELADMIGAIEGVAKKYNMSLDQLVAFAKLRSKVAIEEERKNDEEGTTFLDI
ncbi:gp286 [Bacillus phage G]|uniref:Gp286 n=1 Tax=Bacillus phage G TaxID=2884420 RepID=G3MA27_9CAUD|nr:gp286 [Bacillus phage G]AEO93545.1 gp286 [Bacillus phage G]